MQRVVRFAFEKTDQAIIIVEQNIALQILTEVYGKKIEDFRRVEDTKKENPTDFPTPPPPKLI